MRINKFTCLLLWGLGSVFFSHAQEVNQFDAQGNRHGKWVKHYENSDQIRYQGTFEHGKEVGTFKFYKPDSKKQPVATKTYRANNDTIQVKFYNKTGNLVSQGGMLGQQREGKWIIYHKNSKQAMNIEYYKNNKLHGWVETYFPDGTLTERTHYKHGVLDGEQFIYGKNGQLIQYYTYKNGKLHGLTKTYSGTGKLRSEGNYKNGMRDGEWKTYENDSLKTQKYPNLKPSVIKKE